jgi:hypothetical protein
VRLDPELNADRAPFPAGRAYSLFQKLLAPAAGELAGVVYGSSALLVEETSLAEEKDLPPMIKEKKHRCGAVPLGQG